MKQSWLRQFGFHIRRLLQEFDFVKDLEPSVADRVADTVHRASGQSGDVCFREGDAPEYLYIVIAGYVHVCKDMILEEEDDSLEVRYDEGTIEAQMQCTIMETMLKEREAEQAAKLEKEMMEQRSQRASVKKRRSVHNRLTKTDPDLERDMAEARELMGGSQPRESLSGTGLLTLPLPGSGHHSEAGTPFASPTSAFTSPTASWQRRNSNSLRSSFRESSSLRVDEEDEEDELHGIGRRSRRGSVENSEVPSVTPRRTRASIQFTESEDDMCRTPSMSSRRSLSNRHASTIDFAGRTSGDDLEGQRSARSRRTTVRGSRADTPTVDQAMAEKPDQKMVGSVVAAASRRPGADEVFGVHIATLGPGSIFGETALLEDSPRTASVTCKGACQFLLIGREDFERVLKAEIKKLKLQKLAGPVRHLLSSFRFYQELDDKVQKAVVDIVHYSHHDKGTVFFRQGDPPGCCYIVLSGTVSVWKNDIEQDEEDAVKAAPGIAGSPNGAAAAGALSKAISGGGVRTVTGAPTRESVLVASAISKAIVAKLSSTNYAYSYATLGPSVVAEASRTDEDYGTEVAVLSQGALFGEVSLLEDQPRNATAVCEEACEIFSIERSAFDAVLKSAMRKDHHLIPKHAEAIVEHLPVFNVMRPLVRQHIPHIMKHRAENEGSVIWFSNDVLDRCYLLLSGEVHFWEETVDGDPFSSVIAEQGTEEVREKCSEMVALLSQPEEEEIATATTTRPLRVTLARSTSFLEVEELQQPMQYPKSQGLYGFRSRVVQAGVLFGADAVFDGRPVTSTCTCSKDCTFLVIAKSDFDEVLREEIRIEKMRKATSQVRRVLTEFPIFRDLPAGVIDALPSLVHYRTEKAGHVLFNQGEPPADCFIVLAGEVMAWKLDAGEEEEAEEKQDGGWPASPAAHRPGRRGSNRNLDTPKASKDSKSVQRSPPISLAVRDMCGALANMLAMVGKSADENQQPDALKRKRSKKTALQGRKTGQLEPITHWAIGSPVGALGPGSLVGEIALIDDKPRTATVTCEEDSEFLVIKKQDFDRLVKQEMKRARDAKLEFLRKHVPHFKALKEAAADSALYFFKHGTYPRNHRFFSRGDIADGSIHIVWKGSVEVTHASQRPARPSSRPDNRGAMSPATPDRRLGVLLRGSCFGALPTKSVLPCSAVSASSVCEVLSLSAENLAMLPEAVQRGLREQTEQVTARRGAPLEPAAALNLGGKSPTKMAGSAVQQVGRMASKMEASSPCRAAPVGARAEASLQPLPSSPSQTEAWTLPRVSSSPTKLSVREPLAADLPYPFSGLFKGEAPPSDFREFAMLPGEVLAMTGKPPRQRKKLLEATSVKRSSSWTSSAAETAHSASQSASSYISAGSVLDVLSPWNSRPVSRNGSSSRMPSRGHIGVGGL